MYSIKVDEKFYKDIKTPGMKCTPKVGQIKFTLGGAFFMSKYSEELKLKIVLDHKNKGFGTRILSQMYGPDRKSIE